MNNLAKSSLLFGALILLVFGIVCLKQRFGSQPTPPAFIPSEPLAAPGSSSGQRPTVLSADLHSDAAMPVNPRLGEVSPLPSHEFGDPNSATVPVNAVAPDAAGGLFPLPEGDRPVRTGTPANDDSAATLPAISEAGAAGLLADHFPTTVVTRENDSWWAISERVYGRGDYYKALFVHNRALIEQPDDIPAGVELQVAEIGPK